MNGQELTGPEKSDSIAAKMQDGAELSRAEVLEYFGDCEPNLDEFLQ
jgi:hypothetical protein